MLESLDATIEELITRYSGLPAGIDIISDIPSRDTLPLGDSNPFISVYLYKITENIALRSNDWHKRRLESGDIQPVQPFSRINCSYIITAWTPNAFRTLSSTAIRDEHYMLGMVMSALLSFPNLPRDLLQGELNTFAVNHPEFEFPTAAMLGDDIQSPGEFWSAIGYKIKPFLHYVVTIGVEPVEIRTVGKSVTEIDLRTGTIGKSQRNNGYYLIGGRVVQRSGSGDQIPAPGATVRVRGIANNNSIVDRTIKCNDDGYFFLNKMPPNLASQQYQFSASYKIGENNEIRGESLFDVPKSIIDTDRFYTIIVG